MFYLYLLAKGTDQICVSLKKYTKDEYTRGSADINGIEGFRKYAKERLLRYHGINPQNFLYYLKETEFRFNHRKLKQQ
jgi:transposase-like protein